MRPEAAGRVFRVIISATDPQQSLADSQNIVLSLADCSGTG
jgi:hypothetical protein